MSENIRPDITPEIRAVAEDTFAENLPPSAAELTLDVMVGAGYCHCGESYPHPYDVSDNLIPHSAVEVRDSIQVSAAQMGSLIAAVQRALEDHQDTSMHPRDCPFCKALESALAVVFVRPA